MFIVTCKYHPQSLIEECIASIRKFHCNESIIIVDSDSDDKSYYKLGESANDVEILDVSNSRRQIGALYEVYKRYPNEKHYILIHDTVCLKQSLTSFIQDDIMFKVILNFTKPYNTLDKNIRSEYISWMNNTLNKLNYPNRLHWYSSNNEMYGVAGSMGIYSNQFISRLNDIGILKNVQTCTHNECQFSERFIGYICRCEGIDISESIEGDFDWQKYTSDNLKYIRKVLIGRN